MAIVPTVRVAHPKHGAAFINESDLEAWKAQGYKPAPLPAKSLEPAATGANGAAGADQGQGQGPSDPPPAN